MGKRGPSTGASSSGGDKGDQGPPKKVKLTLVDKIPESGPLGKSGAQAWHSLKHSLLMQSVRQSASQSGSHSVSHSVTQ
eukprot:6840737-Alexandrium_andersonii.AAC.1